MEGSPLKPPWDPAAFDWTAYGESILRPARPRLEEARQVARTILRRRSKGKEWAGRGVWAANPEVMREVWETLLTRFDRETLLADPARQYLPYVTYQHAPFTTTRGPRGYDTPHALLGDTPWDIETCVAMAAADPRALATAEQAALEACARLQPWFDAADLASEDGSTSCAPPRRVAWILLQHERPWPGRSRDPFQWVTSAAFHRRDFDSPTGVNAQVTTVRPAIEDAAFRMRGASDNGRSPSARATWRWGPLITRASTFANAWRLWQFFSSQGAEIIPHQFTTVFYPAAMASRRFRDLPDALDAYLTVWRLGHALVDIRGEVVVLGMSSDFGAVTFSTWSELQASAEALHGTDEIRPWGRR